MTRRPSGGVAVGQEVQLIERIDDIPAGIFGVRAVGTLTAEDYAKVVAPVVDDVTRNRKRLRCLVEVGPDFTGVTPAAAWEDVRLGLRAMRAFDGCAVLTGNDRVADASRVAAFVMPCRVKVFGLDERTAAVEWLTDLPSGAAIRPKLIGPGVVLVEVSEPLRTADFVLLAEIVDGWLAEHPTLTGLVVHTRRVPGWATLGSLLRHVGFVRGHHRRIDRLALASDSRAASVAPRVITRLIHPEVRAFGYDRLDDAIAWAGRRDGS
ncbi:STAS/SEC14 domain-containing protein [Pseudonocardia zijingensis]|uniref:STAS/SEC14 domain-containing protein n=1 Tax=Pseudonocardia zijingensis TaxID=153376 RepID=UPI0031D394B1